MSGKASGDGSRLAPKLRGSLEQYCGPIFFERSREDRGLCMFMADRANQDHNSEYYQDSEKYYGCKALHDLFLLIYRSIATAIIKRIVARLTMVNFNKVGALNAKSVIIIPTIKSLNTSKNVLAIFSCCFLVKFIDLSVA